MKFTKEQRQQYINNFTTNFDKRVLETNIISCEEINSSTFIGVKLMARKVDGPPKWFDAWITNAFNPFVTKVDNFIEMQIEFNKKQMEFNTSQEQFNARQEKFNSEVRKDILEIKQDIIAIKSCPTIKKELGE